LAELGPIQAPSFLKPIESTSALSIKKTRPEVPETGQTDFGNVMKTKAPEKSETVNKETGEKDLPDEKLKSESSAKEDPPVPLMKKMAGRREKEMLKFMDSMESELGVPPEEILVAMSKLAPEDLKKSPEASAELIIRNLDLGKEDEAKALSLFAGMLVATKAPEFFQKPEIAAATAATVVSSAAVPKVDNLIESLEQMNRKFFPQPAKEIQPKSEKEFYVQAKEMARDQQHVAKVSMAEEGLVLPKESLVKPTDFKKVVAELKKATGETSTAAMPEAPMGSNLEDQLKALMGKQESSNGEKFSQGGDKSAVKELSVPTETDPTKFFVPTDGPAPNSALRVDNTILPAALKISPESKTQNIEALSQQARILVKDGGGCEVES
jgi:hypothetical protein